ncbi:hypothetical protein BC834DRAFT_967685 [Gloeopeniophorella convolvens]|nr:hypothetical protein BC834DRAFT_967685 [Gloeopeniophorella convolvens]
MSRSTRPSLAAPLLIWRAGVSAATEMNAKRRSGCRQESISTQTRTSDERADIPPRALGPVPIFIPIPDSHSSPTSTAPMQPYHFTSPSTAPDDSPWADADSTSTTTPHADAEWAQLSNAFTNAGYRDGITAGKESALQEGFDAGFARTGVPLGRALGLLRGLAAALPAAHPPLAPAARAAAAALADVRWADIAPRDAEAEAHAREHLAELSGDAMEGTSAEELNDEIAQRRGVERLEDAMAALGAPSTSTNSAPAQARPTLDDVRAVQTRLALLLRDAGLDAPNWGLPESS